MTIQYIQTAMVKLISIFDHQFTLITVPATVFILDTGGDSHTTFMKPFVTAVTANHGSFFRESA